MNRLFLGLIFLIVAFPVTTFAEGENPISVSGQFRLRAEGNNQSDFISDRDFFLLRVRPEIKFTKDSTLDVFFAPQFAKIMGDTAYVPSGISANTATVTSGNTYDPSFSVHEAYANYHPVDYFSFKAGRQILSYGDELVIGGLEWNNVGRSFDAFKTHFKYGIGYTDLFISKVIENNYTATGKGDVNFYGMYNSFDFGDYLKSADLYLLNRADPTGAYPTNLAVGGLRFASKFSNIDYRAEFTKEFGNFFPEAGTSYQANLEAGYTFDASMKPRFGAEYFNSGKAYIQLYPTAHKWLGYADVLGRRNVSGFGIHADAQVTDKIKTKLDYQMFSRTDDTASAFKVDGGTALGTAGGSTSKAIGSEIDLTAAFKASKDLTFTGGASYFMSGAYLKDQFGNKNPTFFFTQMEVKL